MTPVILRIMQRGKTRRIIEGETFMEHEAYSAGDRGALTTLPINT